MNTFNMSKEILKKNIICNSFYFICKQFEVKKAIKTKNQ